MGLVNINEQVSCDTPTLLIKHIFRFCPLQGISLKITNIPLVYSMGQVLCLRVDYWFYTADPPSIFTSSDGQEVLRLANIRYGENKSEKCGHYPFMLKRYIVFHFHKLLS